MCFSESEDETDDVCRISEGSSEPTNEGLWLSGERFDDGVDEMLLVSSLFNTLGGGIGFEVVLTGDNEDDGSLSIECDAREPDLPVDARKTDFDLLSSLRPNSFLKKPPLFSFFSLAFLFSFSGLIGGSCPISKSVDRSL